MFRRTFFVATFQLFLTCCAEKPVDVCGLWQGVTETIINGEKIKYEPINNSKMNDLSLSMDANQYGFIENLSHTRHPVMITPQRPSLRSFGPVTIPEGEYFMMGDNRDNSADSRDFGFVKRNRIVGQATSIVISLDINNKHQPRWERFFTDLP